jgi:ADP-ribosylglycohydrolase
MSNLENKVSVDHYVGCLLGGAVGDALGAPIEFMAWEAIEAKYGPQGLSDFVEYPNGEGGFTDDTQMTLFTAEGLLRTEHREMLKGIGGARNIITFHSYLRWLHTQGVAVNRENVRGGSYDIQKGWLLQEKMLFQQRAPGNTCLKALAHGRPGTIEKPLNNSKGCGTIMRMAPVGLMFFGANELSFKIGCELSVMTHGHPTGYLSGGFLASMIADLAVGVSLKRSIANAIKLLKQWPQHEETLAAVHKALAEVALTESGSRDEIRNAIPKLGQAWIAEEALAISLYVSLLFENDFEEGVIASVNHSGDSDSTGSIVGNILGLINGPQAIPARWREKLRGGTIVAQMGQDLHIRVKGDYYLSDKEWWERYPGY